MRTPSLILLLLLTPLFSVVTISQDRKFIPVEGVNLQAKLEAAAKRATAASPPVRFWTAYSFDVRPGVTVDYEAVGDDGSRNFFNGMGIFSLDASMETRNLGIFLLRAPETREVVRVEVFNLERRHEYSGYPVYWLGRAGNEESLALLRGLIDSTPSSEMAVDAARALALHDDRRAGAMLESVARSSAAEKVRGHAIFWLGFTPANPATQTFLSDLARNEQESTEIRAQAISAFGQAKDAPTLAVLQNLYETIPNRDLKKRVISAVAKNETKDAAVNFLIKVAGNDPDVELRKKAIAHLGDKAGRQTLGALVQMVNQSDDETEVQKQAVIALSRRPHEESVPMLIKVARTHTKPEVRKQAFIVLGKTGNPQALDFLRETLLKN